MIGLLAAAAISLSCTVDPPRSVAPTPQGVVSRPIGLPPEMNRWTFSVAIGDGAPAPVKLDWPGDPISVGSPTDAIQIGPNDYSFMSAHMGPCLFTNTNCFFMYTLSVQKDGTADILVQPSAIAGDEKSARRTPFQVYMTGRCTPKGERG